MKFRLILLLSLLAWVPVRGQVYTILPNDTVWADLGVNGYVETAVFMVNDTQDSLALEFELDTYNVDPDWEITICRNKKCYLSTPNGDLMPNEAPGDSAYMSFAILQGRGGMGPGEIAYKIFDPNDRVGTEATIHVMIFGPVTTVPEPWLSEVLEMYPQPAMDQVTLRATNGVMDKGHLSMFDLQGRLVRTVQVQALHQQEVDLSGLPVGLYSLQYVHGRDGASIHHGKLVIVR